MPTVLSYNNNVPNGPDDPADDQPLMLTNTQSINSWVTFDHVGFNTAPPGTSSGLHSQVTFAQAVNSPPGFPNGGNAQLWDGNNGAGVGFPFWSNSSGSFALVNLLPSVLATGYSAIAGGLIIQWGIQTLPGTSNPTGTITFPLAGGFPTACFNVIVSLQATANTSTSNTIFVMGTPTKNSFNWGFTGSTSYNNFYWIALGN
jgi:hypothetical protein